MKITVSDNLATKLKAILGGRGDPELQDLARQLDKGLKKNENLTQDELEALDWVLAESECDIPRTGGGQIWTRETHALVKSARVKLAAMRAKFQAGNGAVHNPARNLDQGERKGLTPDAGRQ